LALAYGVIYPRLPEKKMGTIMKIDALLTVGLLVLIGYIVGGFETRFSLIVFETNWIVFTLLLMVLLEMPIFSWFCAKWDIDLFGDDDPDL